MAGKSGRTAAGRGGVGGIRRGHETRAFFDDETGARTTRPAALGRSNDVLAARRSLAVVVSAREPARWLARAAERPQGAVTSAEFGGVTRPARFPTTRPAHARRGRRRSVAATTCSRRGARSLSSCRLESRRGGLQEQQNGRRARWRRRNSAGSRDPRVFRRRDRRTHDEVGGARSQQRRARGAALARCRRVG